MFTHLLTLLASTTSAKTNRLFEEDKIRRYINDYSRSVGHRQRSRGAATKRTKRPNMLHISKRVRRKHRRAAR